MSGLQRFRDRLTPGALLTCVRNTYRPYRDGVEHLVVGVYNGRVGCRRVSGGDVPVAIALPDQKDFVWVDDDTAQWKLGIGAHVVVYRIEEAA